MDHHSASSVVGFPAQISASMDPAATATQRAAGWCPAGAWDGFLPQEGDNMGSESLKKCLEFYPTPSSSASQVWRRPDVLSRSRYLLCSKCALCSHPQVSAKMKPVSTHSSPGLASEPAPKKPSVGTPMPSLVSSQTHRLSLSLTLLICSIGTIISPLPSGCWG